jgi:hypothetical protein
MTNRPDKASMWTILWLLFGGFAFGIGWLVGVVKLWDSRAWTVGEKLLGTFVIPGGLAGSIFFAEILAGSTSQTGRYCNRADCTTVTKTLTSASVLDYIAAVLILIAPIVVAFYLSRQRRTPALTTGIPQVDLRSG